MISARLSLRAIGTGLPPLIVRAGLTVPTARPYRNLTK
jgi:hypothetical protein